MFYWSPALFWFVHYIVLSLTLYSRYSPCSPGTQLKSNLLGWVFGVGFWVGFWVCFWVVWFALVITHWFPVQFSGLVCLVQV